MLALLPEGTSAGRPHLARALVAAGVVGSVNEAFATLLHNGSPYYVPKADTPGRDGDPDGARGRRACAVFAHPLARRRGRVVEPSVIVDLAARRPRPASRWTTPTTARRTASCCAGSPPSIGLLTTGSSDYHGTNKTTPLAAEHTDPDALDALLARASGVDVLTGMSPATVGCMTGAQLGFDFEARPAGPGHPGPARHAGTTARAATG